MYVFRKKVTNLHTPAHSLSANHVTFVSTLKQLIQGCAEPERSHSLQHIMNIKVQKVNERLDVRIKLCWHATPSISASRVEPSYPVTLLEESSRG